MATITGVTSANSTASGATLDVTGITAAIGDWLVLACAADNAGTSGVSSTSATITDAAGNTWTRQSVTNNTPGSAASDGTTLSLWTCPITATLSSASISINFSPDTTSKCAVLMKVAPAAGESVAFVAAGAGATGTASGTWAAPTVSVLIGNTIFGAVGNESRNENTADSDTTNGSWSADQTARADTGSTPTSQAIGAQWKTVTATGNQTYDRTSANAREWAANYVVLSYSTTATLAATEAADVAAFSGAVTTTGTLEATDTADTADFALVLTEPVDGDLAATEDADVALFSGTSSISFTLAATERPDRAAFSLLQGWPAGLPFPTLDGYSLKPSAAVQRVGMSQGASRVYRQCRSLAEVSVTWQLSDWQQALLDGFYRYVADEGGQWFATQLAFPTGIAAVSARFKGEIEMAVLGGPRWVATATLEIRSRPVMSEADLTALLDDAGDPPEWPDTLLPRPRADSWALKPKPSVARSDDLPGLPAQRRRSLNSLTEVDARWELTAEQAPIFDSFFRWRGRDGAQWFVMDVYSGLGLLAADVRFIGEADWTPRSGGGRWAVTAPIEIRERPVISSDDLEAIDLAGLFLALDRLHVLVHEGFLE